MNRAAKLTMLLLVTVLGASCSTSKPRRPWVNYTEAMSKVKAAKTAKGMPRAKVFYHFRLMGVASTRGGRGARNGYANEWEQWSIPDGYTLSAYKHWRANFNRASPDHSKNAPSGGARSGPIPIPVDDEQYYHEPRLEPYFDTLILTDPNKKIVETIELPFH